MAGKAERDEKSSRKEEGRDSSYRSRIDLWTLPRHQEAKSVSPVSFLFPFAGQRLVSFFLHPVCLPESTVSSLSMQPRCGRSCHCSGDRYPSSRLRAKVTTLYLESQLMPPPLSRDHPLIIDEPPSTPVLTQLLRNLSLPPLSPFYPFTAPPRVLEKEARTSGKPAIPITRTIYRSFDMLVSIFRLVSELISTIVPSKYICSFE